MRQWRTGVAELKVFHWRHPSSIIGGSMRYRVQPCEVVHPSEAQDLPAAAMNGCVASDHGRHVQLAPADEDAAICERHHSQHVSRVACVSVAEANLKSEALDHKVRIKASQEKQCG